MTVTTGSVEELGDLFIVDSKFQSMMFLVAFGISKAIGNLAVGILADL